MLPLLLLRGSSGAVATPRRSRRRRRTKTGEPVQGAPASSEPQRSLVASAGGARQAKSCTWRSCLKMTEIFFIIYSDFIFVGFSLTRIGVFVHRRRRRSRAPSPIAGPVVVFPRRRRPGLGRQLSRDGGGGPRNARPAGLHRGPRRRGGSAVAPRPCGCGFVGPEHVLPLLVHLRRRRRRRQRG